MMIKTKFRGIHYRENQDGTRSYFLRISINGKRTWRRAGYTITEAREVLNLLKRKRTLEGLGLKERRSK